MKKCPFQLFSATHALFPLCSSQQVISKISSCDWTLGHKYLALPSYSVSSVPREWKEDQVDTAMFISLGL